MSTSFSAVDPGRTGGEKQKGGSKSRLKLKKETKQGSGLPCGKEIYCYGLVLT